MPQTPRHDIAIAARKLQSGERAEAYSLAIAVLHQVGGTLSDEARDCWDSALSVATASKAPAPTR